MTSATSWRSRSMSHAKPRARARSPRLRSRPTRGARFEVRAEFSDESDQSYDDAVRKPPAGRWIDTVQVRLHEQGGKPRDLLFLKFITYEGTFGRKPLSWQLDYMAKQYESRIEKKNPFANRGLNLAA